MMSLNEDYYERKITNFDSYYDPPEEDLEGEFEEEEEPEKELPPIEAYEEEADASN